MIGARSPHTRRARTHACVPVNDATGSVAACTAACDATTNCDAVNWNAGTGDCEMRDCTNPAAPGLSPGFPGWVVYSNSAARQSAVILNAWHKDAGALAWLCELTPACTGFSSEGKLTTNSSTLAAAPGVTFYVRGGKGGGEEGAQGGMGGEGRGGSDLLVSPRRLPPPPMSAGKRAAARKRAEAERAARLQ